VDIIIQAIASAPASTAKPCNALRAPFRFRLRFPNGLCGQSYVSFMYYIWFVDLLICACVCTTGLPTSSTCLRVVIRPEVSASEPLNIIASVARTIACARISLFCLFSPLAESHRITHILRVYPEGHDCIPSAWDGSGRGDHYMILEQTAWPSESLSACASV